MCGTLFTLRAEITETSNYQVGIYSGFADFHNENYKNIQRDRNSNFTIDWLRTRWQCIVSRTSILRLDKHPARGLCNMLNPINFGQILCLVVRRRNTKCLEVHIRPFSTFLNIFFVYFVGFHWNISENVDFSIRSL